MPIGMNGTALLKKIDFHRAIRGAGWNRDVCRHYRRLARSQTFDPELAARLKTIRLRSLLQHAYQTTRFYRERFDAAGFTPADFQRAEDLQRLPPLTRQDLNAHLESLVSLAFLRQGLQFDFTGGSTGLPTRFARSNACLSIKKANELRFNSWTGWKPGDRILYYWPALQDIGANGKGPLTLRRRLLDRHLTLYAGRLSPRILQEHATLFRRFKPHLIRAFPSALQIFAAFLRERGIALPAPKAIITVGETLNAFQRQLFEEAFQSRVFNCYVSRECGNIAAECAEHDGLHVADELLHLEVVNAGNGAVGEILITDLTNFGMPLIRYRIQDASLIKHGACRCGRTLPRIDISAARLSDYLISPADGAIVSGPTIIHYMFAEGPKVGRFQIEQDRRDHLIVRMAGGRDANRQLVEHIATVAQRLFHGQMRIDYEFVAGIPLLKSGKYQFVKRSF